MSTQRSKDRVPTEPQRSGSNPVLQVENRSTCDEQGGRTAEVVTHACWFHLQLLPYPGVQKSLKTGDAQISGCLAGNLWSSVPLPRQRLPRKLRLPLPKLAIYEAHRLFPRRRSGGRNYSTELSFHMTQPLHLPGAQPI